MKLSEFLAKFAHVEDQDDGYLAHCPAHEDTDPSLRIGVSDTKVLLKCRAGCPTPEVLDALGMSMRDLATMKVDNASAPKRRATSTDAPASPGAVARLAVEVDEAHARLMTDEAEPVRKYAADRFGVTDDDAQRLRLGAVKDRSGWRLLVPFMDQDGVARGYQARALADKAKVRWMGPKSPEDGGSWAKVGFMPGSAGWSEVLVCEGPGDALTAACLGYDAIIIPGAAHAKNASVVAQVANIAGSRKVVIAGDGDEAGWDFSAAFSRALLAEDAAAAVLAVPDGEDLTSWRERDPEGTEMIAAIRRAKVAISTRAYGRALDEEKYPLDDSGQARWLRDYIRKAGRDIRYTNEAGFMLLTDGVWKRDTLDETRAFAQEAASDMVKRAQAWLEAASDEGDEDAEKDAMKRLKYAKRYGNAIPMDSALKQLKALRDVAAQYEDFDTNPDLLAFRNGVVNLRTGELMPHSATFMLTHRLDFDYRPEASAPRWEKFLEEVFPNHPELPAYLQRLVGYGITGRTEEQCFVVLHGFGANGKSVFTDTLTEVFRDVTVTTGFSTFEQKPAGGIPNDLAALKGARLVMASEGEAGKPMAESVLKRVTGRDLISARFMRKEFFEFRPSFLLFLSSNHKPRFRGQDDGLWRRVKMIPWERYFRRSERDIHLGDKLLTEREGIAAWAVRGAMQWYADGRLSEPESITSATDAYRVESNPINGFLPGEFVLTGNDDDAIPGAELWQAYMNWVEEENLPARERWTRRGFYGALRDSFGLKQGRTGGRATFRGIRAATAEDVPAETSSEGERVAEEPVGYFSSDKEDNTKTIRGASLDDL